MISLDIVIDGFHRQVGVPHGLDALQAARDFLTQVQWSDESKVEEMVALIAKEIIRNAKRWRHSLMVGVCRMT